MLRENFKRHPETGCATMLAPAEEMQCEHECEPGQCEHDRRPRRIDWLNVAVWLIAFPAWCALLAWAVWRLI